MAASLLPGLHRPPTNSSFSFPRQPRKNPCSVPSPRNPFSASVSPSTSSWEREEQRWLREEQRWLREEQRWLREESRWVSERDSLLREIAALRHRIEALERDRPSLDSVIVSAAASKGIPVGNLPRSALVEETEVQELILEEVRVSESTVEKREMVVDEKKKKSLGRQALRRGSEGNDVRLMQEALQRLGFYSGEEDMEYSSFSSGTERAVRTWQATVGAPEDGIMTADLLEWLFMEKSTRDAASKFNADGANGAVVASIAETTEIQQKAVTEDGDAPLKVSERRVFLLGENRWEEPSRLIGRGKPFDNAKFVSHTKCLSCRGEGRVMCSECDGSGEPNIEPQFLEWAGEDAKCQYCEGLGYTTCDVCRGGNN
ncbi:protein disulfide isomerase pTAC5, chloroplastic-like [Zingiber officinale]|uniref:protein disulfide isomerase pTAC5, chloroplastic-like n=1 Tax=Zingiber officinale TaxID=94328 RepID=UPI001C4BEEA0|nr:protein disulfide isomerase pTAC5, chloroplastic-like [Zingiber officinale]